LTETTAYRTGHAVFLFSLSSELILLLIQQAQLSFAVIDDAL
jgi:hypothetical protein